MTENTETTGHYAWIILALFLFAQLVMSMGSYAWGPLASFIRDEYGVNRVQLGLLTSALYLASILVAVPSGILVDKIGARIMLILCLMIMGLSFCLISICSTFWLVVVFTALGGLGYGVINQASSKGILLWFPRKRRATAMGIKQMGVTLGGALSAVLLPIVALGNSWKLSVLIIGVLMLLMAFVSGIFYREKPEKISGITETDPKTRDKRNLLINIISNPVLIIVILVMPCMTFSQSSVAAFLVLYLDEKIGLSIGVAGSCLTVAMIAGTAGRIVWGLISDIFFHGDRIRPAFILSLIGAVSFGGIGLIHEETTVQTIFILSALIGFTAIGWNALLMILGAELVVPELVGSYMGIFISSAFAGTVIGPPAFGYLVDTFSYQAAWTVLSLTSFLSAFGFAYMYFLQRK